MFKSARWRSEKNKIKVVFKLQFYATQVSQVAGDALMISLVPADVGRPTIRLEKAKVRAGSCYWEKSVLETVKFVQEPKSGKIHERIYNLVVGTGSSKAGVVGEASIDFSNYAEASKVSSVSLPLKNSKSGAVLHVSIQRIQDSADKSIVEEIEHTKPNSDNRTQLSDGDMEASLKDNSMEDGLNNKHVSQNGELSGNFRVSSESDITMSSTGSSSGLDIPQQIQTQSSIGHQDHLDFPSANHGLLPQKPNIDVSTAVYEGSQSAEWEWLEGSALEVSTDGSSSTPTEALLRLTSQEPSDIVVERLKSELLALSRQAEMSDLELQTLRKQIIKESKRGQDLSKEVASLKEERDAIKKVCDKLKASQKRLDVSKSKDKILYERGDLQALVNELRQELNYQKDLNDNLQIQLQKTQESNSELILAVCDLDEMLEQKNKETLNLSNKSMKSDDADKIPDVNSKHERTDDDDEEQKALERIVREHVDAKDTYMLEQKIMDLHSEIEIYRRDRDDLEMQMEQLALDYEILKQENHDMSYKLEQSQLQEQLKMQYECSSSYATVSELEAQIGSLENELKKQSNEFSDSLVTISELEAQIGSLENELKKRSNEFSDSLVTISELEAQIGNLENELKKPSKEFSDSLVTISELKAQVSSLEEELENQAQGFEADLDTLTRDKVEQERRAIRAEEALRKTRSKNVSSAERLQEEFKRLSIQMASSFEANEKIATQSLNEANELRLQKMHLEDMLQKSSEELQSIREHYEARVLELSSQVSEMSGQIDKLQSEIEEKSEHLGKQEELAKETGQHMSQKILVLEAEIENLLADKTILSEDKEQKNILMAELENMRKSIEDMQYLVEQGQNERRELETRLALVKKEAMDSVKELNTMRSLKDEKEELVEKLHLEVDNLKSECHEMKNSLFEDELGKEKLRKQVSQLKGDLKKKEDALNSLDKKLKDASGRVTSNGTKATSKNHKSAPTSHGSREVASLKEKIKLLEGQIKLKENALDHSTNSFLQKEKDLQHKIEELERIFEELKRNTEKLCEQKCQKVASEDLNLRTTTCTEDANPCKSSNGYSEHKEIETSASNTRDLEELSKEMELLRETNKLMEGDLKEMQERYSGISLKFAEVEGERQQLVMKLRNLKNKNTSQ